MQGGCKDQKKPGYGPARYHVNTLFFQAHYIISNIYYFEQTWFSYLVSF